MLVGFRLLRLVSGLDYALGLCGELHCVVLEFVGSPPCVLFAFGFLGLFLEVYVLFWCGGNVWFLRLWFGVGFRCLSNFDLTVNF